MASHSSQSSNPDSPSIEDKLPRQPTPSSAGDLDAPNANRDHPSNLDHDNAHIDLSALWGLSDSAIESQTQTHENETTDDGKPTDSNDGNDSEGGDRQWSHSGRSTTEFGDYAPTPSPPPRHKSRHNRFDYSQDDIKSLRNALQDNNPFRLAFYFLDYILRAQTALFEQIHRQQQLPQIIASMAILTALLSAIYGLTMGMNHSILQSIAAAIKLPILFMLTAIICIPSLYTFNVLLGQRFKFLQTVTLMVMTLGTTCILLASLAPIAFFFSLTTHYYPFLLLLNVAIFGLCGIYGVQYLYRGCVYLSFRMEQPLNTLLLRIWIVIYSLVGMQLGWRLRPFVGNDGSPFQIVRSEQGGNFYIAVWNAILALFGGN